VLSILRRQSAQRIPASGLLAVVADAVYAGNDERLPGPLWRAWEEDLPRLPGSAGEARDLLELAGAGPVRLLDGFEARRDRVLDGALAEFRIVHFATHARTQAADGRPLGLVLSRFDKAGRPLDDMLGLAELYNLALPAELAVLSACSTILGEDVAGEGLMGLTRGFMHAGATRVVVSLWDVRDSAARESMRRFYRALLIDGAAPGEALRQAQASMWRDGWPVRDWAVFVLQGDWRPFPIADR
jgi:CHAT domain-containing protein